MCPPNTPLGGLKHTAVIKGIPFVFTKFQYIQDKQVKISLNIVSKGSWVCDFLISCWPTSTSTCINMHASNPSTRAGGLLMSKANLVCNAVEVSQDYAARPGLKNKNKTTQLKSGHGGTYL